MRRKPTSVAIVGTPQGRSPRASTWHSHKSIQEQEWVQRGAVNRWWAAICLLCGMSGPSPHLLEQLATVGPWSGPSYRYRGGEIHCLPGGHVCGLVMRDHPLNGVTL